MEKDNTVTRGSGEHRKIVLPNSLFFDEVAGQLAAGLTVTLPAKGGSMYPFICGGRDAVVLRKAGGIARGDIVLARVSPSLYVLHRVRSLSGQRVVLMGDANLHDTEECGTDDVCGTVYEVLRGGRRVDCGSWRWRMLSRLWLVLLPLRRYLLFALRRCGYGR